MKKAFFLFYLLSQGYWITAQVNEITVGGKVTDAKTGRGVTASIKYSSLPTGSIYGKFNDSLYSFQIFGTARYQVSVDASGYNPKTIIVDPEKLKDTVVFHSINLVPKGETVRLNHLIFPQGEAVIDTSSFEELDEVVQMMQDNNQMVIQLEGHTDNQGNAKANMSLSEKRVIAVKKYMVSKGIQKDRIKTKAFGGTKPLTTDNNDQARAMNRRVEMRILKQ